MEELFKNNVENEQAYKMYHKTKNSIIGSINPGIPTVIHYINTIKTNKYFEYSDQFGQLSKQLIFPIPKKITATYGDGTLPTSCFLLPSLKWAYQFHEAT